MTIKVENKVMVYKEHGENTKYGEKNLVVKSTWNDHDMVLLLYEGMEIEVVASDLHAAINNATNVGRRW